MLKVGRMGVGRNQFLELQKSSCTQLYGLVKLHAG
jgi:hypothetical protein